MVTVETVETADTIETVETNETVDTVETELKGSEELDTMLMDQMITNVVLDCIPGNQTAGGVSSKPPLTLLYD